MFSAWDNGLETPYGYKDTLGQTVLIECAKCEADLSEDLFKPQIDEGENND